MLKIKSNFDNKDSFLLLFIKPSIAPILKPNLSLGVCFSTPLFPLARNKKASLSTCFLGEGDRT